MIGENGSELSGGEHRRISIAKAFLKDGIAAEQGSPADHDKAEGICHRMVRSQLISQNWKM